MQTWRRQFSAQWKETSYLIRLQCPASRICRISHVKTLPFNGDVFGSNWLYNQVFQTAEPRFASSMGQKIRKPHTLSLARCREISMDSRSHNSTPILQLPPSQPHSRPRSAKAVSCLFSKTMGVFTFSYVSVQSVNQERAPDKMIIFHVP